MPVHCSASGKLLLAYGAPELREHVLLSAPYRAYTKNTITSSQALASELEAVRERGHAEDDQELLPGVNCLAVPVRGRKGEVVAGLAVMAPATSTPLSVLRRHLPEIAACAAQISASMAGRVKVPRVREGARVQAPAAEGRAAPDAAPAPEPNEDRS